MRLRRALLGAALLLGAAAGAAEPAGELPYAVRLGHERISADSTVTALELMPHRRGDFYYPRLSFVRAEDPVEYRELELTTIRVGAGYAPSWTLAPFVELDVDLLDAFGEGFAETEGESHSIDRGWTFGLRWRLNRRWSILAYHRVYHVDDSARAEDAAESPFIARYTGFALQHNQ